MSDDRHDGGPGGASSDEARTGERKGAAGLLFVTIAALLCGAAAAVLPLMLQEAGEVRLGVWGRFFGDMHLLVLHLPVGIFLLVIVMELCGLLSFGRWAPRTSFALFVGVATGVLALITGHLLHLQGDHSDAKIQEHLWGSTVFVLVGILAYVAKIWADHSGVRSPIYGILLLLSVGAMGYATHEGGVLVHGNPFVPVMEELRGLNGSGPAKEAGVRKAVGIPVVAREEGPAPKEAEGEAPGGKEPSERLVYQEVIVPILRAKCHECHAGDASVNPVGGSKVKGGLDMSTIEGLKKGGDEYHAVVAGDVKDSLMIERIMLPIEDDEHMPPPKKPQIADHELEILEWWIEAGLPEGKTLAAAGAPPEIVAAAARVAAAAGADEGRKEEGPALPREPQEAAGGGEGEEDAAVEKLMEVFPNALQYRSHGDERLVFTAVGIREEFGDAELAKLAPVGERLVELDLSSTGVTDGGLEVLSEMPGLRKLWLSRTGITDEGLEAVRRLSGLEYLNLYGTAVTDEGLAKLEGLDELRNLYLWLTKVTNAGRARFKESHPECEVNLGRRDDEAVAEKGRD